MKKRVSPVLIVVLLIILVIAAGGLSVVIGRYLPGKEKMDSSVYFHLEGEDQVALVLDQEILEKKGKMLDGSMYIDGDTVGRYINTRFYWGADKQEVLNAL